jgi:hypothetical protein
VIHRIADALPLMKDRFLVRQCKPYCYDERTITRALVMLGAKVDWYSAKDSSAYVRYDGTAKRLHEAMNGPLVGGAFDVHEVPDRS